MSTSERIGLVVYVAVLGLCAAWVIWLWGEGRGRRRAQDEARIAAIERQLLPKSAPGADA